MEHSIASLVEQLPHWQHPSSTRLQDLDLLQRVRENQSILDDSSVRSALESGSLDAKSNAIQNEAEIEALELRLKALRRTGYSLNLCSEVCTPLSMNPRAPIAHLPDDILVLIFEMVCVEPSEITLGWQPPERRTTMRNTRHTMAGVCYRWRNLVFNTPGIWSNIRIRCERLVPVEELANKQLLCLKELVLRSRLCPLQATIYVAVPNEITPFWVSATDFLQPHFAARCQSITFLEAALPFKSYRSPWLMLENFHLKRQADHQQLDARFQVQLPSNLPALRTLELGICPSRLKFKLNVEWHRLTKLDGKHWEVQEILQVLPQCINLQELRLFGMKRDALDTRQTPRQQSISLPLLRRIYLEHYDGTSYGDLFGPEILNSILRSLDLPSLMSLHVESEYLDINSVLRIASSPLTDVVLTVYLDQLPELRILLRDCLRLESLGLTLQRRSSYVPLDFAQVSRTLQAFLHEMTAEARAEDYKSHSTLIPKLRVFKFSMYGLEQFNGEVLCRAFIDMVRSRHYPLNSVSRLRSLHVNVSAWREFEELAEIRELDGMHLSGETFRR